MRRHEKKADYPNCERGAFFGPVFQQVVQGAGDPCRAESVLTPRRPSWRLPAETAAQSTITQIYEGTNQIQRMVMARHLLKG
jgi:hypothetical protein